jgi:hypothetical protein
MENHYVRRTLPGVLLATSLAGCSSESERVAQVAEQALAQQAAQNEEMARLNREVAEGTQNLVEADAKARREILEAQRDLQSQQGAVNQQRDALESERKEIADDRRTDSVLGPIVATLGTALLCLLPVAVACFVLWQTPRSEPAQISELLIEDLASERPKLLPPAPQNPHVTLRLTPPPPGEPE